MASGDVLLKAVDAIHYLIKFVKMWSLLIVREIVVLIVCPIIVFNNYDYYKITDMIL